MLTHAGMAAASSQQQLAHTMFVLRLQYDTVGSLPYTQEYSCGTINLVFSVI